MDQIFGYLDGVGCSPFSQVVTNDPHVQCIWLTFVSSQPSHKHIIFLMSIHRHRVLLIGDIINQDHAR